MDKTSEPISKSDFIDSIVEGFQKRIHEVNQKELEQQKEIIARKFSKYLEVYQSTMEPLPLPSEEIRHLFPIPVLVDPTTPIAEQKPIGDDDFIESGQPVETIQNYDGIVTPDKPYIIWVHPGDRFLGKNAEEVRTQCEQNSEVGERPLTFLEGVSLYRVAPDIFFDEKRNIYNNQPWGIMLAGSTTQDDGVPYIYHNYFDLHDSGEFQIQPVSADSTDNTVGWPTCWVPTE